MIRFTRNKLIFLGIILILFLLNLFFLREKSDLMFFFMILLVLAAILPFVIGVVIDSKIQKDKEARFLEFARDLVESVRSGTPISKAILNLRKRDYGTLTPHVQKLSNQLNLGITLTEGLITFANDIDSKMISRAVGLISEAERSGGEIETILNSVANSVNQIEELKKEQASSIYNLIVQGYIIFVVFIIIVLVLQYYILPMAKGVSGMNDLNADITLNSDINLSRPLLMLLVVQSFFAGLVIGKIAEGSVKEGIKHSFILLALTLIISSGAKVIFGGA